MQTGPLAGTQVRLEPKELPFIGGALGALLKKAGLNVVESGEAPALLSWVTDVFGAQFLERLGCLWTTHTGEHTLRTFVLFSPARDLGPLWESLPPTLGPAIQEFAVPCTECKREAVLEALGEAKARKPQSWAAPLVRNAIEAEALQRVIVRSLGHNASADVSNHFLAPGRLLLLAARAAHSDEGVIVERGWSDIWKGRPGVSGVGVKLASAENPKFGNLGKQLAAAATEIGTSLSSGKLEDKDLSAIERLMALLTECRNACGERTAGSDGATSESDPVLPVSSAAGAGEVEDAFRVLVVDDHAAAWRCVFEKAAPVVAKRVGHPVLFQFSLDGESTADANGTRRDVRFGLYHLVILDVFLGGADASGKRRDGRTILKERIRPDLIHTPVLLWTTSRDDEITTDASRANGVLLKKTIGWVEFCTAISEWLRIGRAKGRTALPSPIFNHNINDEPLRRLVIDTNEWCLKQLDSFHALDGEYFRYFTDHGGRHIVTLFGLLEQALRPFLAAPRGTTNPLLPDDRVAREKEMTALSLAVVCHELGMFPMRSGKDREDFSTLGPTYLNDVRTLHPVRGMALLHSRDSRFWGDAVGAELGRRLHSIEIVTGSGKDGVSLGDLVAVLVGYHARLLRSLRSDDFLKWKEPKRFESLRAPAPTLTRADSVFRDTLEDLGHRFATDRELKERLRRQCALFRFVDAIDITASRNPAHFLIHSPRRGSTQNREYLKRELCPALAIEGGKVTATVLAAKPKVEELVEALGSLSTLPWSEPAPGWANSPDESVIGGALSEPWHAASERRTFLRQIQPHLDKWLEATWEVLMGVRDSPEFLSRLRRMRCISSNGPVKITRAGKRTIASLTALSVAAEVLDEYEAVEEGGLDLCLQLGSFGWSTDWRDVPEGVTILGEALRIYSAGRED